MGLNVELLERSFELLKPQADTLVSRFYERLFEKYPAVKPMFARTTMPEQKKKLLASLVLVMQNLRRPDTLGPALKQLGARHVAYGTQPAHYGAVADTLLGVMAEMAGTAWTSEVKQAWTDALNTIAQIMLEGARDAATHPAPIQGGTKMAKGKTAVKAASKKPDVKDLMARAEAINRVQAVIEFELDGTIITANDNFLNTLGYTLDEIKGHHHRMFCDQTYTNSQEYQAFWAKLNRGEFDAGVYKRIGKGGKEVWIQASYNPIMDANGKPYKVVKFASDVTEEKKKALVKSAMDNSGTNVLMCDRNLIVTYINKAAQDKLKGLENEIRKVLPSFNADKIVGTCIDGFHKMPSHQRNILENPKNLPHKADIQLGPLQLELNVGAIISDNGEYLGNSLEWSDVTAKRKADREMTTLKNSLDNSTSNVLMCDRNLLITYINKAASSKLKVLEMEIRKVLPAFNADKIVGVCIDSFHKVPDLQRRVLGDPKNLPHRADIKLGPLTLSLTVSAIVSESGEYLGNTLEWADITAQKRAQTEVDRLITAAAAGQLAERINASEFEGFFKTLSEGINKMLDAVVTPLHEAQTILTCLAGNDLTKEMTGLYEGEFDQMKTSLNTAVRNLTTTMMAVRESVDAVSSGSEQITKGNEDLSQRTSEQASALEETSASMEEMTSTVKQNADNAKQANQLAITARDIADKGGSVTSKAVEAMGEINKSSKKIADIITVIDEIAFQTNLLALNAAVEAARAGEHGRGFAVVAAEVRNLAQRSATAAKEIKGLINESIQRVSDGSELVNQSGKTLDEIVSSVKRVTDIIAEITAASQEQASGIDQVNKAIMQMDETTQQNAALVEETTAASQSVKEQARELMRQVEVFKTNQGEMREARPVAARHESSFAAKPSSKPMAQGMGQKPGFKKPAFAAPQAQAKTAVGMAAGNGKDRRKQEDDFEEF
ncbi:MAG: methyl-accepting chemotaxis protein [Nitrospirota bacterium]|nr:methyl-accepting chemotaxis protein [Nitrospirota bacterium]